MSFVDGEIPLAAKFNDLATKDDLSAAVTAKIGELSGYQTAAATSADLAAQNSQIAQNAMALAQSAAGTAATQAADLVRQTLVPLSKQYMTLANAQADIANIPTGSTTYVRSPDDNTLAIEYMNISGTLTATGRVMPSQNSIINSLVPYNGVLPLTKVSEFNETGVSGSEYEMVTDQDVLTDKDKNVIRCIRAGKQLFFVPIWSKEINADKLFIAGTQVDPAGIPPTILSTNLLGLSQFSQFLLTSQFSVGGEYESITDSDIQIDSNYNIISCLRGGKRLFFVPVVLKSLTTNEFILSGSSQLINSSMFNVGGEYEAWSGYTDIQSEESRSLLGYLKDGIRHVLTPLKLKAVDSESIKINGVDIFDAIGVKKANRIPYEQFISGKSQVFVFNTETGVMAKVTDGTANETKPSINDAGLLVWDSDRDSTVIAGKFFQAASGKIYPLISRTVISGWGDSFMEQPVLMNKLQSLTGLSCYNFGKSGLRSTAVASRQGGEPFYCMPDGGVIPASGSVNLLPNVPGPAASAANGAMTGIKCSLGGVDGTFNWSGTQATFIRDATGSAASVPAAAPLFVYPYTTSTVVNSIAAGTLYNQHDEAILIVTCGRNNTTISAEVLRNITNIIGFLKPYGKRFVVCPQFTQSTETRGTDGYQRIHTINAALKAAFPNNYVEIDGVDLMQNFKNHYNPAYAQDVTDIANDTTPTSLRTDALHPSQVLQSNALYIGAEVNANFIYQFMKLKGWVS